MSEALATDIQIRAAEPADLPAISRIMNHPPEPPMAVMLGSGRASRVGDILVKAGIGLRLENSFVAEFDQKVAGVMECGIRAPLPIRPATYLRALFRIVAVLGPVTPRAAYGFWLRSRVGFEPLPHALPIGELYVDERMRNRGIGGRLLDHAEEVARGQWPRMWIETGITNPAQRLYERHGFRVIQTKTDARYERLTGSPGRILMVKEL